MATPNVGILTNAGKNLIDQVNAGKTKITFSKVVFSSMDNSQLSDTQVKTLTAIAPQEVVVSSPEMTLDTNSGETRIRATGTNEKLADGVYVKTYGVFAKDDTGSEILYGVTVSPNPNYFPAYDGVTPQAVTYSYKTVIQETSNITMTNSNDVYASQEDLTEALQPYAKTVDVNQQLDKKVNIADMRKPASDVAGIAEVNAKQDKIAYTPADDSKVVHDNHDNTITANNLTYDLSKTGLTPLSVYKSGSFNYLPLGTVFTDPPMTDGPDTIHSFTTTTFLSNEWGGRKAQIAIADNVNLMYFRVNPDSSWNSWTLLSDDSKVVHTTDMRKPASDVAGIEEVNAKQDKIGYTPADDSKVVHNSGDETIGGTKTFTNPIKGTIDGITYRYSAVGDDLNTSYMNDSVIFVNTNKVANAPAGTDGTWAIVRNYNSNATNGAQSYYDTNHGELYFRTRNNNTEYSPWIQVADDSKVAHLSGANNFDTVPTVKNNPLLLASSLPSDLARTSQQTNFTAGLQSGGVDVATAADLKSIETSAWREMTLPDVPAVKGIHMLYKIDVANNLLYIVLNGEFKSVDSSDTNGLLLADLSAIVKGISGVSIKYPQIYGSVFYYHGQTTYNDYRINFGYSGTKLMLESPYTDAPMIRPADGKDLYISYGSTIKYTELV